MSCIKWENEADGALHRIHWPSPFMLLSKQEEELHKIDVASRQGPLFLITTLKSEKGLNIWSGY
jgi:hypothetical protein